MEGIVRTGFISLVAGCLLAATAQPALADGRLQLQRTLSQKAKTELEAGRRDTWLNNQAALKDYPLASYLAYDELTLCLRTASDAEVEQFLEHNADLPQLRWLKLRWLRLLAERDQWPLFYRHY